MKNILIYSNMYPSAQRIYSGIFVKNQFELLQKNNENTMHFDVLAMERKFTGTGGSIKKYLSFMQFSLRYLFKKDFDVIHVHYFFPLAIIPWIFKKAKSKKNAPKKLIVTIHGSDFYEKMNNKLAVALFKRILKNYDYIISVGKDMEHDFEELFGIKVNRVLCAGIDKNVFYPLNTEKIFDFLFVGSVVHRKGFDIVLETIKKSLSNELLKAKWCIVGSGEYAEEISELSSEYPEFCTYYPAKTQKELNEIYNKSKWFFFPSRNEPFGLVASESIFAGTPAIVSANGGLKEQVIDKLNGRIIKDITDKEEIESLIVFAKNISNDEYSRYRENCLNSNYFFSLQYVCDELSNLYKTI
jgi:L-malate glycosyltransferase